MRIRVIIAFSMRRAVSCVMVLGVKVIYLSTYFFN
jgi:hypothetical protein